MDEPFIGYDDGCAEAVHAFPDFDEIVFHYSVVMSAVGGLNLPL
jgi:hypothetical protein